jgi:hypothetical protein
MAGEVYSSGITSNLAGSSGWHRIGPEVGLIRFRTSYLIQLLPLLP